MPLVVDVSEEGVGLTVGEIGEGHVPDHRAGGPAPGPITKTAIQKSAGLLS